MFLDFFHLSQQPFSVTPDPAYLYPSPTHRVALTSLLEGIKEGRGFLALIAEPGMGKTTLLYQLLEELRLSARTAFLFQTQCDSREFFQYLLSELGADTREMDLVAMHNKLNQILFAEMLAGRRFVLIVDEAQNLDESVLETVRLLSNFETSHTKLLQIVLAGQPQLAEKLAQPQLAQLRQRIAVAACLEPLSASETASYVEHRLKVAGSVESLFTPEALDLVAQWSKGIPRNINNVCYSALSEAYAKTASKVALGHVQEAIRKLDFGRPVAKTAAPLPSVAEVPASAVPAPAAPELSYESPRRFRLPRWVFRPSALTSLLVVAGLLSSGFVLRLTETGPAAGSTTERKAIIPAPSYSAAPQETGSTQVITVAALPQQTLEQISLQYVGYFDQDLLKKICAMNPELRDPGHLDAGELIRLPLPLGSFKKGKDLTSEK